MPAQTWFSKDFSAVRMAATGDILRHAAICGFAADPTEIDAHLRELGYVGPPVDMVGRYLSQTRPADPSRLEKVGFGREQSYEDAVSHVFRRATAAVRPNPWDPAFHVQVPDWEWRDLKLETLLETIPQEWKCDSWNLTQASNAYHLTRWFRPEFRERHVSEVRRMIGWYIDNRHTIPPEKRDSDWDERGEELTEEDVRSMAGDLQTACNLLTHAAGLGWTPQTLDEAKQFQAAAQAALELSRRYYVDQGYDV